MSIAAARPGLATASDLAVVRADRRAEVVDGELVEKAAPTAEHGTAQLGLGAQLFGPFHRRTGGGGPGGWWLMTEVEVQYEDHQIFRHDIVGFRRDTTPHRPTGSPVGTRPDWACEVLSPSNASTDLVKKLRVLHAHGVPHYWILDPEHQTLTVMRWTPEAYLTPLTAAKGDVVRAEPFDAIELDLAAVFGDEE